MCIIIFCPWTIVQADDDLIEGRNRKAFKTLKNMKTIVSIAVTGLDENNDDFTYNYSSKLEIDSFILQGLTGLNVDRNMVSHVGLSVLDDETKKIEVVYF